MSTSTDSLRDHLDASLPPEAAELGRLAVFLVCLTFTSGLAYRLSLELRGVPVLASLSAPGIAGLALPTLAYARYRGFGISIAPPRPAQVGVVVAVVLTPLGALLGTSVVTMAGFDTSFAALLGSTYHPRASFVDALSAAIELSLLGRGGYGLLVVVVVELLRTRVRMPPMQAVVFTAVTGMVFHSVLRDTILSLVFSSAEWRFYAFAVLLVATIAGGVTLGFAFRGMAERSLRVVYRPVFVPVFALGLFLFAALATLLADVPDGFEHAVWMVAFGSAAYGYDRTDSLWVPIAVLVLFDVGVRVVGFFELAVF